MLTKGNVKIGLEWRFGPDWPGQRCGAKTSEGLKRISQANIRHGKYTKDKLEKHRENAAKRREIKKELRQIEQGLVKEGVLARDWRQHFPS